MLGLYGADDAGIKVEQVKAMEEKLKSPGKTAEFHIYPGAPHGFTPITGRATVKKRPRMPGTG